MSRRWRRIGRRLAFWLGGLAVVLLALRLLPHAPLRDVGVYSTAFLAEDGQLLRLSLATDQQYRLWTPLEEIAPQLRDVVQHYEDRAFSWHPGVNPWALLRSAWVSAHGERRQGGSTLTMQLARRVYAIDSRSVSGKLRQIAAALWLEARYSKREILEAYLNFAPYGGNIEGVGAASLIYLHKPAARLSLPEAISLAVIPQNPAQRGAARTGLPGNARTAAHLRLAQAWLAEHPDDARFNPQLPPRLLPISALPFAAPHLSDQLYRAGLRDTVRTTLSPRLQDSMERVIAQFIARNQSLGLRNASALLVDTRSMAVRALVGSADFHDEEIEGQVNGVLAKRSPGSTLKPFVYALAIDQGVLHPRSILKDAPTAFGPFSPENFDGDFVGPITAEQALVRSRNVPAVAVASRLGRPNLYDLLKQAGTSRLASEAHYGLALTLGGGELTMEELTQLYAMLARQGVNATLRYTQDAPSPSAPISLLSEEAAFITLEMLKSNPRPDTGAPAHPAVAWKTGTSWGFRDAWTIGVFDGHVLAVWIGNFDGSPNPAFVGVRAAAPLFFHLVDALRSQRLLPATPSALPPRKLTRVDVCAASGDLPNDDCPERTSTWFIPGKSPIRISRLHQRVLIDQRTGAAVCTPSAHTRLELIENWPPDMRQLFARAGMPRRTPPLLAECGSGKPAGEAPRIVTPLRGPTYLLRLSKPSPVLLRADASEGTQYWFADSALLGQVRNGESLPWLPPHAGRFLLRVIDQNGLSDTRELLVEAVPD